MDAKLDADLCKDFPVLYKDRNAPKQETCMCWGFSCGDGWHGIIRELSAAITHATSPHVSGGNMKAASGGYYECGFNVVVGQVKEKFGTLRFYYHSEPKEGVLPEAIDERYAAEMAERIYGLVEMAERMSSITCEVCGNPGTLGGRGWMSTLCEPCRAKA